MSFGEDLFRPASAPDRDARIRVKAWASSCLELGAGDMVLVTELRCHEPGCPPLETLIAVLRSWQPTVQTKIHRAAADVSAEDVVCACGALPASHPHKETSR
jgi:hypothetical protein